MLSNPYKEFKIVTFYDQANEHQHAVGTAGNHEALGKLMRREAAKLKFAQADEKISVSDGAEWIRKQLQVRLPMLDYPAFREAGFDLGSGPTEAF